MNSNGQYIFAANVDSDSKKGIYQSSDYGQSWNISSAPKFDYRSITSNRNGSSIAAVASDTLDSEFSVVVSTDSGASWKKRSVLVIRNNY